MSLELMNERLLQSIELENEAGFQVGLLNYGATIHSILVPLDGRDLNVVLSPPRLQDYLHDTFYLGATVGRYAGRIDRGRFALNGRRYQLATGDNMHCLHGGPQGFSRQIWSVDGGSDSKTATFHFDSPDGDQGFPGKLAVSVRYSLRGDYGLLIEYQAVSDAETVINLSNHAYFNLNGNLNGSTSDITNHSIAINADRYAVPNEADIPTGELREVDGSRFDLRQAALLMDRIGGGGFGSEYGYDHTYELNGGREKLAFAAAAHSPDSGFWLKVHTTQPALQFYTGEYLGSPMQRRGGFCFEAQNFPDAPNQPVFPCAVLEPGNTYSQSILYEFGHADCAPI
jgi:aldose 1-epimerase